MNFRLATPVTPFPLRLAAVSVLAVACWAGCQTKPQVSSTTPVSPARPGGNAAGGAGDDPGPRGGSSGGPGIVLPDSGAIEVSAPPAATVDANCGLQNYKLQRRPAEMLLILDRSGSMRESPIPFMFGAPSKWDETIPAVREKESTLQWSH